MRNVMKFAVLLILSISVLVLIMPNSALSKWPTKRLVIVVPFGPGGTTDRIARAMAPFLQKEIGVPVIMTNRPGGGGIIGTKTHIKNDPTDGSFIMYSLQPYLSGAVVKGAFKIDNFDYIGVNYYSPQGLWVHAKSKYTSARQLLEDIKANPNKITMSVIPNSWSRAANALIGKRLGHKAKGIPYQGGGAQRMAVVKKDVVSTITEVHGTLASAAADMKCLAVFDNKRVADIPDVPTINEVMKEMGYKPMPSLSNFRFFFVKKGFKNKYPDRWNELSKALVKTIKNPEYQKIMTSQKLKISWKDSETAQKEVREADKVLQQFAEFWR